MAPSPNAYRGEEPEIPLNPGENSNSKPRGKAQGWHASTSQQVFKLHFKKKKKAKRAFSTHVRKSVDSPTSSQEEVEKIPPEKNQDPS